MAEPFRPYKPVYTAAEVVEICKKADLAKGRSSYLVSSFRPAFTDHFVGKEMLLRFDHGVNLAYTFVSQHELRWSMDGVHFHEEYYEALESTVKHVFLIHHIRRDQMPYGCTTLFVDMDSELVTWVSMTLGTDESDANVNRKIYFGYWGEEKNRRHTYTDQLCGVVLDWKYSETFIIRHEYITPDLALSPGEPTENAEDYLYRKFLPARYVEVRKNLYIMTFIEDGGTDICFLIDMDKYRNVGAFFGLGGGGIACYTVGAIAKPAPFGFDGTYAIGPGPETLD